MSVSASIIPKLRATLHTIEGDPRDRPFLPFGPAALDGRLADGGLRLDALHEVSSRGSGWGRQCRRAAVRGRDRGADSG